MGFVQNSVFRKQRQRREKLRFSPAQVISDVYRISERKSKSFLENANDYRKSYLTLVSAVGHLFREDSDARYKSALDFVHLQLERYERELEEFTSDPTVKTIERKTKPSTALIRLLTPLLLIPRLGTELGNYIRQAKRNSMSEEIRTSVEKRFSHYRSTVNVNPPAIEGIKDTLEIAEFGMMQRKLPTLLRKLLEQLNDISESGGGAAARLYLTELTSVLPSLTIIPRSNLPLFLVDNLPRIGRSYSSLQRLLNLPYASEAFKKLGESNAIKLYEMLYVDKGKPKPRWRALMDFYNARYVSEVLDSLKDGVNPSVVAHLISTLPLERRHYGFDMLLKHPQYAIAFEGLGDWTSPKEYMIFLLDYADIPVALNGKVTPIFEIVNEVTHTNKSGAAWLIRNPSIWTDDGLDDLLEELKRPPAPVSEQPAPQQAPEQKEEKTTLTSRPTRRVNWLDMVISPDNPQRPLVDSTYRRLAMSQTEHRLKYVPREQLEQFCQRIQVLPTPVLTLITRDDALFNRYLSRLEDDQLHERLQDVPTEENLYKVLIRELQIKESRVLTLISFAANGKKEEPSPTSVNGKYRRIAIWGDIKSEQQQSIQAAVNGTDLIFVHPSTDVDRVPYSDAVIVISRRGVSHGQYEGAKEVYRGRGADVYHLSRQVGVKSIANAVRNIQSADLATV
ncbi:MAG: hypothetical protein HY361_01025 [Candidatus Aenigmarchaeota archaeon]|nr:hypothetical protein [Candidatus Aenigmarchaeota archaeon]